MGQAAMGQESAHSVLRRLLRQADGAVVPEVVSSTRALRLAMARSAVHSIGLHLTVLSVREDEVSLDELLAEVPAEHMLVSVDNATGSIGLAGFDLQTRTAIVEVQTIGELRRDAAPTRKITASDVSLCQPFLQRFLDDLQSTAEGTSLEGWIRSLVSGDLLQDAREAGMVLRETRMRLVRLSIELTADERQGEIILALPLGRSESAETQPQKSSDFTNGWRENALETNASLHAVLHRLRLPLRAVEVFCTGQVIALPGITVGSVRLEAPDGVLICEGRLGQMRGLRAVRITDDPGPVMNDAAIAQGVTPKVEALGSDDLTMPKVAPHQDVVDPAPSDLQMPTPPEDATEQSLEVTHETETSAKPV